MAKLFIEYRTEDNNEIVKDKTYFTFGFKDKITHISIAPKEKRLLRHIVYGIEKQLQDGLHLQENERFEISKFDKTIMKYEETEKHRVDSKVYNFVKNCNERILNGETTLEKLFELWEKRGVANASNN